MIYNKIFYIFSILNRIKNFSTYNNGWFNNIENDGLAFDPNLIKTCCNSVFNIFHGLYKNEIYITQKQIFVYACPDNEILIELDHKNTSISLLFSIKNNIPICDFHYYNFENNNSKNISYIINDFNNKEICQKIVMLITGEENEKKLIH